VSADLVRRTAVELLTSLGSTPHEVAAELLRRGVVGKRESATSCPIARVLTAELAPLGVSHVCVVFYAADLWISDPGSEASSVDVPCPYPVAEFTRHFDTGNFPELEAPAEGAQ
jgi:hypothetical protein